MLVYLLKCHGWPGFAERQNWLCEMAGCQAAADQRFTPSMRQRIDLAELHKYAVRQIELTRYGGEPTLMPPRVCPVTLEQLLNDLCEDHEAVVSSQRADDHGEA